MKIHRFPKNSHRLVDEKRGVFQTRPKKQQDATGDDDRWHTSHRPKPIFFLKDIVDEDVFQWEGPYMVGTQYRPCI